MTIDNNNNNNQEVDVLNLPSRKKKHGQRSKVEQEENKKRRTRRGKKQEHEEAEQETETKKKKSKRKLNYFIIRLLLILFILIVILLLTHQKWVAHVNLPFSTNQSTTTDNLAGEKVTVLPNNSQTALELKPNVTKGPVASVEEDEQALHIQTQENQEESAVGGGESNQPQYYQVKDDDTLFSIAIRFYGSKQGIEILKEANQLTSDQVNTGQVLLVPPDLDVKK